MSNKSLGIQGLMDALKSISGRLPKGCKPRMSLSCHRSLQLVALNITRALRLDGAPSWPFRVRIRNRKRGWKLSANFTGGTISFESRKDV